MMDFVVCKIGWGLTAKGKIILKPYVSLSVAGLSNFRICNFLIFFNLTSEDQRYLAVIHVSHVSYKPTKYLSLTFQRQYTEESCSVERKEQILIVLRPESLSIVNGY